MKNKGLLFGIAGVLVILFLIGGAFMFLKGRAASTDDTTQQGVVMQDLPKIDPKELGLSITITPDKKYVSFSMTNVKDISHIDWEITYEADVPKTPDIEAEEGARVTQNLEGSADIKADQSEFQSEKREIGTCSTGGKCRFDTNVSNVKVVVKIKKTNGKEFQSELTAS